MTNHLHAFIATLLLLTQEFEAIALMFSALHIRQFAAPRAAFVDVVNLLSDYRNVVWLVLK